MRLTVARSAAEAARLAAARIAAAARDAIELRGRCVLALSGGTTPTDALRALAGESLSWSDVHVVQADERVAPRGHPDRNLTLLEANLLARVPVADDHVHPMPVEGDLPAAVASYEAALRGIAGAPPVLDVVQLGLGDDGHTASLVPGDGALEAGDADVAATGPYRGRRRLTLTLRALDRARCVVWLVTGPAKARVLRRLLEGDPAIPAGRVRRDRAEVIADRAAMGTWKRCV